MLDMHFGVRGLRKHQAAEPSHTDGIGHPDCADGNVACANAHSAVEVADGRQHARQIQQRLAHAHEHCDCRFTNSTNNELMTC